MGYTWVEELLFFYQNSMTTTSTPAAQDPQVTQNTVAPVTNPVGDEFDLDISQVGGNLTQDALVPEQGMQTSEASSGAQEFDFSLDLPSEYGTWTQESVATSPESVTTTSEVNLEFSPTELSQESFGVDTSLETIHTNQTSESDASNLLAEEVADSFVSLQEEWVPLDQVSPFETQEAEVSMNQESLVQNWPEAFASDALLESQAPVDQGDVLLDESTSPLMDGVQSTESLSQVNTMEGQPEWLWSVDVSVMEPQTFLQEENSPLEEVWTIHTSPTQSINGGENSHLNTDFSSSFNQEQLGESSTLLSNSVSSSFVSQEAGMNMESSVSESQSTSFVAAPEVSESAPVMESQGSFAPMVEQSVGFVDSASDQGSWQTVSALDPFEAMKVSLQSEPLPEATSELSGVEEFSSLPPLQEGWVGSVQITESFVEPVAPSAPIVSVMPTEASQSPVSLSLDAMSETMAVTPAPTQESGALQSTQELQFNAPTVSQVSSESSPQMLSLDEMISQPQAPISQTPPVEVSGDQMSAQASVTNPLTAPVWYPPIQQSTTPVASNQIVKILTGVFGVVLVGAVAFMAYLKYPLLFQQGADVPEVSTGDENQLTLLVEEQGSGEHNAAPVADPLTSDAPSLENAENWGGQETDMIDAVNVEIPDIEADVQDIVLEDPVPNTPEQPTLSGAQVDWTASAEIVTPTPDALNAIEDLVGPVNNNDILSQQITNYKQQAQQIADTGKVQGQRSMIKWGMFVVKEVEKVEQQLANGGNITISEWNAKKAELDLSLAKATHE